ncbi:SPOR domain-containing protein [Aliidiomarina taiwanensis]|nr:SPOR domain-containing protein [Aliidiomarina taiwanensis]
MAGSPLQNRVVGTVCVVALAVIILPDLFGNAGQAQRDDFQVTPLSPTIDSHMQSPDFPRDFATTARTQRNSIAVPIIDAEEDSTGSEPSEQQEVFAEDLDTPSGDRWVIQLGAFRNADSVEELLAKLRDAGFAADSRVVRRTDGALHLLFVGPDLNKETLNAQLEELKELTALEGKVVPYQPANN